MIEPIDQKVSYGLILMRYTWVNLWSGFLQTNEDAMTK